MRCMHESQMHKENSFVTLTYNLENVPAWFSLDPKHLQKFIRALRQKVRKTHPHIRFFSCGEYGEQRARPHYHVLLFGYMPTDLQLHSERGKNVLYRSPTLEKLWKKGFVTVGEVNFTTARYCASYTVKKVNGDLAQSTYRVVDDETGEVGSRLPEFGRMSRNLGKTWLEAYWTDLHYDHVIVNGRPNKPPRFYDLYFAQKHPERWEEIEYERAKRAKENFDGSNERLAVKEAETKAAFSQRKRSF